jgi:hypothetical protein
MVDRRKTGKAESVRRRQGYGATGESGTAAKHKVQRRYSMNFDDIR